MLLFSFVVAEIVYLLGKFQVLMKTDCLEGARVESAETPGEINT